MRTPGPALTGIPTGRILFAISAPYEPEGRPICNTFRVLLILKGKRISMRTNLSEYGVVRPLLAGAVVAGLALWLRHGVLEPGLLPRDCTVPAAPVLACLFKQALVQGFLDQRIGWVALAAGALAFVRGSRAFAWAGWLSGVAGLVLYSYDPAAVGGLLALLVLVRAHQQDGQGQREAGQQPADRLRVGRFG